MHRDEVVTAELAHEDKLAHVLFSTRPEDIGLYGKPMARNVQLWTHDFCLLLDGPRAKRSDLERAFAAISQGGSFGYRFQFPPMQVGLHQVFVASCRWRAFLVGGREAGLPARSRARLAISRRTWHRSRGSIGRSSFGRGYSRVQR